MFLTCILKFILSSVYKLILSVFTVLIVLLHA